MNAFAKITIITWTEILSYLLSQCFKIPHLNGEQFNINKLIL